MENVIQTVAAQYGNSPTLLQLIDSMNQYFDPTVNFEDFYDYVWNVDTAQGFGLDYWGRIVNVARTLTIPGTVFYFGFNEQGAGAQPFDSGGTFYDGVQVTQTYVLADDAYRTLILTKALANISASTAPSLNALLQNLFPNRGRCYVVDLGGMQMQFTFEFDLVPYELAVLTQSGVIPRPAGVQAQVMQIDPVGTFGFSEQGGGTQPFGYGVFFNPTTGVVPVI